ncbi:MAG: DNA translocase FtsK [Lachnospiraceae bacterium]|nr:DNA translocase FtsK [Lachnospiraceae bacterium]
MAAGSGNRTGAKKNTQTAGTTRSGGRTGATRSAGTKKSTGSSGRRTTGSGRTGQKRQSAAVIRRQRELYREAGFIVVCVFLAFLFLCNFGLAGPVGSFLKGVMFGLFGLTAYLAPLLLATGMIYWWASRGRGIAHRKIIPGFFLLIDAGAFCELFAGRLDDMDGYGIAVLYQNSAEYWNGGGVLGGSLAYFLYHFLSTVGAVLILLAVAVICAVLLTEKSFVEWMRKVGAAAGSTAGKGADSARRRAEVRSEERRDRREKAALEKERQSQEPEEEKRGGFFPWVHMLNDSKNAEEQSVTFEAEELAQTMTGQAETAAGMEMPAKEEERTVPFRKSTRTPEPIPLRPARKEPEPEEEMSDSSDFDGIRELTRKRTYYQQETWPLSGEEGVQKLQEPEEAEILTAWEPEEAKLRKSMEQEEAGTLKSPEPQEAVQKQRRPQFPETEEDLAAGEYVQRELPKEVLYGEDSKEAAASKPAVNTAREYRFPPIQLLNPAKQGKGDSRQELAETAKRLQSCLETFGVKVTITDISRGPAVTRYEIQPEQGVKVSKIVNLSDDIKLNLAATDIRIEAPIPGKAAIGIEVPNRENSPVMLRELLESGEFKNFHSKLAFAVGKDISGKVVGTDIAKMPHVLIAGATGSGKSVCINTIILSLIYKATPEEVQMIMIDPKVVELNIYNGIPHLMIPVVTDPKKAAAALHWGVAEMMDRYEKFAQMGVRDLKGYNNRVESLKTAQDGTELKKLPQIVIIVDELADLMMVSPGEVEESICRLAQLARAAGIHLIIATQRPSVDVITGLIKANMPSRIAFSVTSGVDSRTILDMVGAEKLLGKGDMLFYPQGYAKPVRIQGALVTEEEISKVVEFLKNQKLGNVYQADIEEKMKNLDSAAGAGDQAAGQASPDNKDALFADAGRFIIEKDKASIGMLQRAFRIGFNRAARIMDQLCDYGVVGEEEGTKPRKVLMSPEQFEQLLEEI